MLLDSAKAELPVLFRHPDKVTQPLPEFIGTLARPVNEGNADFVIY
jgi:hypothetical protein